MLEKLTEIIRQQIEAVVSGKEQFKGLNIEETTNELFKTFKSGFGDAIVKGNIADLLGLFTSKTDLSKNAVVDDLIKKLTEALSSKDGLSFKSAFALASDLIPKVISQVNEQIQQKTKGFEINGIINSLTGTMGEINFDELLKTIETKVGKVDLNDLAQKLISEQKANSNKFFETLSKLIDKK
jgi:hypothetical protein